MHGISNFVMCSAYEYMLVAVFKVLSADIMLARFLVIFG
jgi:hypothetical protein